MPALRLPPVPLWLPIWLALGLAGGAVLVRWDIAQRREAFQDGARVAHRLLSQRAAQHDAILATLALLPAASAGTPDDLALRLPQLYPQLLAVLRREPGRAWDDPALAAAEDKARLRRAAEIAAVDARVGRYTLVVPAVGGGGGAAALRIDAHHMVLPGEWPLRNGRS